MARNFKNDYFTHEENRWLDGYVKFDQKHSTSPLNKDAIFYCVAQACLQKRPFNLFHRKNLYLRLSAISRSFGNATTWETPFDTLAKGHLDALRKYVDRAHSGVPVQVIAPAPPSKIRSRADLIYLDPPYILASRSTETYAQRYHFIDGLSSPNSWESWNKLGDSPWYKSKTLSEPWGDRAVFLDLLATVLDEHRESICVMSYMDGGYPSAETLTKLFKKRFKKVNVHKRSVQRALSISESGELLIVGE